MTHHDTEIQALLEQAVAQTYDAWSAAHPSLAAALDRITIQDRAATRLRESDEYHQAIDAYHEARNETHFLNRLLDLAGVILPTLMAG